MIKAFGYARVSGKGQIKGDGIRRQESAIKEYASKHGIEILHIYKEKGVSGTIADRPKLAELLVAIEQNGHDAKTVIIERVDRLARDLMVQEAILQDFAKSGIEIVSVHDGDLLSDDPTRTLIRQVLGAVAQYDKAMTVLKLKVARDRKRIREGKCEGRKGYKDGDDRTRDTLREIRRLRRKRKGRVRRTYAEIARILNETGYRSADGKPFTDILVRGIVWRMKR